MNIIETIQRNLGHGPIRKVDPNTQEVDDKSQTHGNPALAQAAIPTVLLGIFNFLEKDPRPDWLTGGQQTGYLLDKIFGRLKQPVIEKVMVYSSMGEKNTVAEMEHIAAESVRVVYDQIIDPENESRIEAYVAQHKPDVLLFLPASMQLGALLGNSSLDDRTHKMDGPVSGLMHRLEKQFNSSENT
ncbi:MAG TPA: hypothetical protein VG890_12590 [Puia sp.]|nr:hypothetical protein [Puia sp.]